MKFSLFKFLNIQFKYQDIIRAFCQRSVSLPRAAGDLFPWCFKFLRVLLSEQWMWLQVFDCVSSVSLLCFLVVVVTVHVFHWAALKLWFVDLRRPTATGRTSRNISAITPPRGRGTARDVGCRIYKTDKKMSAHLFSSLRPLCRFFWRS